MLFINWKFITKSDTTRQETGLGLDHLQLQGYENNVLSPDESVTNTRTDVADSQINSDLQDKEKTATEKSNKLLRGLNMVNQNG